MKSSLRNAVNCHEHNFHPKRHTSMCPLVVSETLLLRRLCFCALHSTRRRHPRQVAQSQAVVASQPQPPAAKYLPMRPCLENWNRFSRFTAASSSLLSHWPNQHLLLRAQSCSVKRHQWRHGWFCHCLHARVYYEFCFASVNGKWI